MDRANRLGEERIAKLLVTFSVPAIIGMLVNSLYNIIDRIFIGNGVGSLGIAGITLGFPIPIVTFAFSMLVGIGATTLVSIRLGEQRREEAEKIVGNAFTLFIIISVVLTVLGLLFLNPLLKLFGASNEVLPYARDYIRIILLGTVFGSIGFGMNSFIQAEGNPRMAMATMILSAVVNAVLAPIFIFLLKWGMTGAGLATVIAQAFSGIWVFSYFARGKSVLKLRKKNLKPDLKIIGKIATIGAPSFLMQLASSLLGVITNKALIAYGGDVALSGMGIIYSIQSLMLMPVFGICQGAQPIIGYNYGAKKYNRTKQALKLAIIGATVIIIIGFLAIRLSPEKFIMLFNSKDKELIKFGTNAILIFFFFMPIVGFQILGSNFFQAIGKMRPAMILSLSRQVIILIPAVLILPKFFGLNGVLYSGPLADLLSTILTAVWLAVQLKKLSFEEAESLKIKPNAELEFES